MSNKQSLRKCNRCGRDLTPTHDGCEHGCTFHRPIEPGQWDNALIVQLQGGYGMFVDPIHQTYEAVFCHDCAHQMVEELPWLRDLIGDPLLSHSHREGTVSDEHMQQQREAWANVTK